MRERWVDQMEETLVDFFKSRSDVKRSFRRLIQIGEWLVRFLGPIADEVLFGGFPKSSRNW